MPGKTNTNNDCFLTSKRMLIISILGIILSIIACFVLTFINREIIRKLEFNPSNNIVVNIISSTNTNHSLKLSFLFLKDKELVAFFNLYEQKSIDLIELRKVLSFEICDNVDPTWKQFCILDSNENLKLYYKYCKEFLKDQNQFPNSTLTTETAELFMKKFEILEKTQKQCNNLGQCFFIGVAIAAVLALSIIIAGIASFRLCFCSAKETDSEIRAPN